MKNALQLIFTGYNQRAVIAFIRTLSKNNIPFAIIAKSKDDTILQSSYKSSVYSIRKKKELDMVDIVNCIVETKKKNHANNFLIAPSTEALNRFIIDNRDKFEELNCYTPLAEKKIYELISDKYSFSELCVNNGIKVPALYKSFKDAKLPFVAKPIKYFSKKGEVNSPVLILSVKDKINFKTKYDAEDFFYQEFVTGKSLYLLYYFHRNGLLFKYSQENITQQPDGKSIIAAVNSKFHLNIESLKYEQLFRKINYNGFVMVEIKRQTTTNYMIEANPRFWGPSQLFVDSDKNFFEAYLHDYGILSELPDFSRRDKSTRYFWLGGMLNTYKDGKNPVFHKGNEKDFLLELHKWIKSDIYKRKDTVNIFKSEII